MPTPAPDPTALAAALVLGDGRFPTGGHAHSSGLEEAVAEGCVGDTVPLAAWIRGRLHGPVLAEAAVVAWVAARWPEVDIDTVHAELDARTPSAAGRSRSHETGRHRTRTARRLGVTGLPPTVHRAVADGALAAHLGLDPLTAATLAAHDAVAEATSAAVRLLGLDPWALAALQLDLRDDVVAAATAAADTVDLPLAALPADDAFLATADLDAHATRDRRLFAS